MTVAISQSILRKSAAIRRAFQSKEPLPEFTVVENFLSPVLLKSAVDGCRKGRYSTFCAYSDSEDMQPLHEEFCEPNEKSIYVSVHERLLSLRPVECLRAAFENKATIEALSEMTGVPLKTSSGGLLTCWQPGSFLECHTDHAPGSDSKVVVSLSLTGRWHPSYGGVAVFSWGNAPQRVRVPPHRNTAIIFRPFSGSYHWVEQIAANAPARRRFTWTVSFG